MTTLEILLSIGALIILAAVFSIRWMSGNVIKRLVKGGLKAWFRVSVNGLDNLLADKQAIIVANHASKMDALLLSLFFPERLTIALDSSYANQWSVKILRCFAEVIWVDSSDAKAARALIKAAKSGKRVVLFPESRLSNKDGVLKLYQEAGFVIDKAKACAIPVRISGVEKSVFSVLKDKNLVQWRPKIELNIASPVRLLNDSASKCSKHRRQELSIQLYNLVRTMKTSNALNDDCMFQRLLIGAKLAKKRGKIIEDMQRTPLSYAQFIARCFILGRQLKRVTHSGEFVGVMMPTSVAGMVTLFALQAYRRIPAMLNFTSGFYNLKATCITAKIKTVLTSRQFVKIAKVETVVEQLQAEGLKIIYLEDYKQVIGLHHKIAGLFKSLLPGLSYRLLGKKVSANQPALVLFTSGSEGIPKGVVLSHRNVLANVFQLIASVEFYRTDVFFNALPIFHSFGITAGAILPLVTGSKVFFYPSPLHYKIIPGLVYETSASLFFATDTFLTGYAHYAKAQDFNSIRYIFAGAEKVKLETQHHWMETFGACIFEGYGVTEASPVIAVNTPDASKQGSVGQLLPLIQARVKPVEGIAQGGRLWVKGPNVMLGYLRADNPGEIEALGDKWYDTGDIVSMDEGFVTIQGRAKRFAKIGGEMVSLMALESVASSLWPEHLHAALIKPDEKKGEKIVLLTEHEGANRKKLVEFIRKQGLSELLVPKVVHVVDAIPVLASGKIDYVALQRHPPE